ncbi:hypothetical protein CTI12_AA601490 [Artemisia annua]|uniref:Uncharacterized protein n=1 Tax=Artemisia annua TaxID=35608 RepID=A0A2U1KHL3_ARTAN|nr:hypothetical protein CTI12_AA601490 [Artemisia annua]
MMKARAIFGPVDRSAAVNMAPPGAPGNNVRDLNIKQFYVVGDLNTGFYVTLTEPLDCGRSVDQFKEMEPKLHLEVKEAGKRLFEDPQTTVLVLSGCHHSVFDEVVSFSIVCQCSLY